MLWLFLLLISYLRNTKKKGMRQKCLHCSLSVTAASIISKLLSNNLYFSSCCCYYYPLKHDIHESKSVCAIENVYFSSKKLLLRRKLYKKEHQKE